MSALSTRNHRAQFHPPFTLLVLYLVCGTTLVFGQGPTGRYPPPPPKKVTTVKPEPPSTVIASGEVRPVRLLNLTSEVNGRIQKIYVNIGDNVTKGQALVLIEISQETLFAAKQVAITNAQNARDALGVAQQRLVVAEAAVAQAKQDAVTAEVDLNSSARELRRSKELVESGVASRSEYDTARDRYDQAKSKSEARNLTLKEAKENAIQQRAAVKEAQTRVDNSEKRVNQLEASLRGQSSQREKGTLKSPLNGVVADISTRVGEVTSAGLSGTPLMAIADMSTITVEVNVDAKEISRVKVGQQAAIKVDAFGEKKIRGVVTKKDPVQKVKESMVTVELREMSKEIRERLRPGMTATATIMIKKK